MAFPIPDGIRFSFERLCFCFVPMAFPFLMGFGSRLRDASLFQLCVCVRACSCFSLCVSQSLSQPPSSPQGATMYTNLVLISGPVSQWSRTLSNPCLLIFPLHPPPLPSLANTHEQAHTCPPLYLYACMWRFRLTLVPIPSFPLLCVCVYVFSCFSLCMSRSLSRPPASPQGATTHTDLFLIGGPVSRWSRTLSNPRPLSSSPLSRVHTRTSTLLRPVPL